MSQLRDQLAAAQRTIGELENELTQLHRLLDEGTCVVDIDDLCPQCLRPWGPCECDEN